MLTPEQVNQIRTKSGLAPLTNGNVQVAQQGNFVGKYDHLKKDNTPPEDDGILSKIKEALTKRADSVNAGIDRMAEGKQSFGESVLQLVGNSAGGVGDVIGEGIKAVTPQPVKDAIKSGAGYVAEGAKQVNKGLTNILGTDIGKAGLDALHSGVDAYKQWSQENPRAASDLESVVNIAMILPATKAANVAGDLAVNTGKTVLRASEDAGKTILKGAGGSLEKVGEFSVKSAIPLSKAEAGLVQTYKANNPFLKRILQPLSEQPRTSAITAIEKGFAGSEEMIGVQAKKEAENLWVNKISPALKGVSENYSVQSGIANVESKILKIAEPSRKNSLIEALTALKEDYKGLNEIPFTDAQEIKSGLDQFIPDKAFQGKPIAGAFKDVQKMFADDIRNQTYTVLKDQNIRNDFLDYGNLKKLQAWGQTAMTGSKAKAGFGSFISNLSDTLTIPAKTVGGKVLIKAGKTIKTIAK